MSFNGTTIWITGATSGIGEALAYAFAETGARLILSARREERLHAVKAACAHTERHRVVPLDLSETDTLATIAEKVVQEETIDILFNNGGISQRGRVAETDLRVDRQIMEVNFFGTVALTKAVLPSMLERGSGHIVVISSVAGKLGAPQRSAYSASKHALQGFFDVLRAEVHDAGLRVTIVCPGYIRTDISKNALTADGSRHGTMDQNQAEGMSPETCARRILRAIEKEKEEVYIGGKEVVAIYLKRFVPNLLNRILRKRSGA
ncbi:MAG TPA: SDR family oxidoreductase [Rhodothermales bacterium]|nr:SDR family oxidoreductase [Rhodothermales bacterium]